MKKATLLTALVILAIALTACGSATGSSDPSGVASGNGSGSGSSFRSSFGSRALTPEEKLALGTIKLEGTPQAIDAKTAAKLIPLWQLMVQLHSSSSSAPQEVDAVMEQIKATMTPAQLNAINAMTLSGSDMFTVFQDQAQSGGSNGTGGNGGFGGNRGGNGGGFVFRQGGGGGFGGGGFGGGGFGGGFAGGSSRNNNGSTSSTTSQDSAAQAAQARQNAISSLLENQLVRLLETKLTSQPG